MKIWKIPKDLRAIIFDIDNTLYRNKAYVQSQTDLLIERLASEWKIPFEECRKRVNEERERIASETGIKKSSLANVFFKMGIPMEKSISWRLELFHPEQYLSEDRELEYRLKELNRDYVLAALTNNPIEIGKRSLEALGISDSIEFVVGLDSTGYSKPSFQPFLHAASAIDVPVQQVLFIGDRQEVDIDPALELGMGGVLVESMDDLYDILKQLRTIDAEKR